MQEVKDDVWATSFGFLNLMIGLYFGPYSFRDMYDLTRPRYHQKREAYDEELNLALSSLSRTGKADGLQVHLSYQSLRCRTYGVFLTGCALKLEIYRLESRNLTLRFW